MYDFRYFPQNGHSGNGIFAENKKKSYKGSIRKNPRICPSYHFCDFPGKIGIKLNLGIKMKV